MKGKRPLLAAVACFGLLLFVDPPGSWLFDPDEARYAEIPREMMAAGDYVTPRLNGSHYLEKPPLLYWLNALSMSALGETPFAARLPVRLATISMALLLIIGLGGTAGPWAALAFLSMPLAFALGRINVTDGILTATLTFTLFAIRSFLHRSAAGRPVAGTAALVGLGVGLTVLAKGLIGVVFPGAILFLWCALTGRWAPLLRLLVSPAPVVALAVAAPWFVAMEQRHPGFSQFFFIREHFQRFSTDVHERQGPPYYFLFTYALGLLPWLLPLVLAVRPIWGGRKDRWRYQTDPLFFALWTGFVVAFFSFSHSKLVTYIFPAFPPAAALLGLWLSGDPSLRRKVWMYQAVALSTVAILAVVVGHMSGYFSQYALARAGATIAVLMAGGALYAAWAAKFSAQRALFGQALAWLGIMGVLTYKLPVLAADYSDKTLAEAIQGCGAHQVVGYKYLAHSVPWVLKRPIPTVSLKYELASDGIRSPELFWSDDYFWNRWNSEERMAVITRREFLGEFTSRAIRPPWTLRRSRHTVLLLNFDPR